LKTKDVTRAVRLALVKGIIARRADKQHIMRETGASSREVNRASVEASQLGLAGLGVGDVIGLEAAAWVCGVCERRMRQFLKEGRLGGRLPGKHIYVVRLGEAVEFAARPRRCGWPTGRRRV
jgi:hypothetical protein